MRGLLRTVFVASILLRSPAASAQETCGDGVDNNSNGLADDGCRPHQGICESPVSCTIAGAVAPKSGVLTYNVLPDLSPTVAYGPPLEFKRHYESHFDPGYGSISDYRDALGYDWMHSYGSWLDRSGTPPSSSVVVHLTTGADVYFSYASADATWTTYSPQKGFDVKTLRQRVASPYDWELTFLDGTTHTFSFDTNTNVGKLTGIKDGLGQTVTVSYNADGKVSRVTDASGTKYFDFVYASTGKKLLTDVKFYADATLRVTVSFGYTNDQLTSVSNGGTTIESYAYTSGYLTSVADGDSKTLASFAWSSAGKAVRANTPEGDVGYSFADTGCNNGSGTYVFYNRVENTGSCTSSCASGYCGGIDSSGNGQCFEARRCVAYTSPSEDLLDTVTASCSNCVDTADYEWDSATLDLKAKKDADNVWTSYIRNSNGLVTKMVENDTDSDASTVPSGARVTWFFYGNSTYPGLVTEIRRLSELKPSGTCSDTTTTDCKRTVYTYTSGGQLDTVQEVGFTYSSTNTVASYDFTTNRDYDSKGRLTLVEGPRANTGDDVEYAYWDSSDGALSTDYLRYVKRKKSTGVYVTTEYGKYDFWGKPKRETDPNSKSTCSTYESRWGLLASRRVVVGANGDHTCVNTGSDDETTSWDYDTHRRETKKTAPRGNCWRTTYDSEGRPSTVKQADYDSGTSSCSTTGNYIQYTWDEDGRLLKTEWKDSAGVTKRSEEQTYGTDLRVYQQKNPVSTSYVKQWTYDPDGVPAEVLLEDYSTSAARRQWDVDNLNRTTAIRDYTSSNSNEAFSITAGVQLNLPTRVRDPASKDLDLVWDDLGRRVKQVTPDAGTTLFLYDEAGNLTSQIENFGGANQSTSTFTYDTLNRVTAWNTGDTDCTGGGAEIQYTYDALPVGESCPSGSSCNQLAGRLAYVKAQIICDAALGDARFDQRTYYSYREGDLIAEHTVQDDSSTPRVGRVVYTYDKNHNVTRVDYPTGTSTGAVYTFGSTAVSDDDKVTAVKRDTTSLLSSVSWYPFGPYSEYTQANAIQESDSLFYNIKVTASINAAYRRGYIHAATTKRTNPTNVFRIDFAEDVRQRYTKREFSYGTASQKHMFFLYDNLSRLTCRTTSLQSSCPTSGGAGQMESVTYNNSSDRTQLILNNAVISNTTYNYSYFTGADKIDCIRSDSNSCTFDTNRIAFAWDGRGNRLSDDDKSVSDDDRVYTYDGRNNVKTISGKFWYATGTMHSYVVTNAYDERNRRIFKSFKDTSNGVEAQWFYYYDQWDRLVEAKYTPNIATSSTYSVYYWYYLEDLPFLYYQVDSPGGATTRRFLHADEQGRPHAAWSWPSSGSATRVWEVEAGAFGWDVATVGASMFQPLRFAGQFEDSETAAAVLGGSGQQIIKRPALLYNWQRHYDPFVGMYLQVDPLVVGSLQSYAYARNAPTIYSDPTGLLPMHSSCGSGAGFDGMSRKQKCAACKCSLRKLVEQCGIGDMIQYSDGSTQSCISAGIELLGCINQYCSSDLVARLGPKAPRQTPVVRDAQLVLPPGPSSGKAPAYDPRGGSNLCANCTGEGCR